MHFLKYSNSTLDWNSSIVPCHQLGAFPSVPALITISHTKVHAHTHTISTHWEGHVCSSSDSAPVSMLGQTDSQADMVLHLYPRGELVTAAESKHRIQVVFEGNTTSLLQGCKGWEMSSFLRSPNPNGFFCVEGMIELLLLGSVLLTVTVKKIRKASWAGSWCHL